MRDLNAECSFQIKLLIHEARIPFTQSAVDYIRKYVYGDGGALYAILFSRPSKWEK